MSLCMIKIPIQTRNHSKSGCMDSLTDTKKLQKCFHSPKIILKKLRIATNSGVYFSSGPIAKTNVCK